MKSRPFRLAVATAATIAVSVARADDIALDTFAYPSSDAARKAWVVQPGSPPPDIVPGRTTRALRLTCPFASTDLARTYVDRAVSLDLTGTTVFMLDVFMSTPSPTDRVSLYFRSGDGWYAKSFAVRPGWNEVTVRRMDFGEEDMPAGWDRITGIRFSPWKARAVDGHCLIESIRARRSEIVLVKGTAAIQAGNADGAGVETFAETMRELLVDAGIDPGIIGDADVAKGALDHAKLAVFPYNPVLADGEGAAVKRFVDSGGKIIVCYSLAPDLAEALGVTRTGWEPQKAPGRFAEIRAVSGGIAGLPASVKQGSWNTTVAEPAGRNARVIARWHDAKGADTGIPAVIKSDTGVFMGHVVLADDPERKRQMLTAWVGHFLPEVWSRAARRAMAEAVRVGPLDTWDALAAFVAKHANTAPNGAKAHEHLAKARALLDRAEKKLAERAVVGAIETANTAAESAAMAYACVHSPRECEYRAVWNHSGTGAYPGNWTASIGELADAGFNMVVPNMWWGGIAHYDSEYLPHSETFRLYGDQIAQCVAAGRKRGIEVHPWKVNWNLTRAPAEFINHMRREGRLQEPVAGDKKPWLCPSHPANFELELKTMVEVAQKYDVDGVHFDYIRYPHANSCYCRGCRERFEASIGKRVDDWPGDAHKGKLREEYRQFRRDQITRLIKAVSEGVHRIKPWCKISAAVFSGYPACRDSVAQDWGLWLKEGYLDFVCPMNYFDDDADFASVLVEQMPVIGNRAPFCSGVGVTLRWTHTPAEAIHQMLLAREIGADGYIVFDYSERLSKRLLDAVGAGIFAAPALLPHNAPDIAFALSAKAVETSHVLQTSDDTMQATVTVRSLGEHRKTSVAAEGKIRLEDMTGRVLATLATLNGVGRTTQLSIPRRPGRLRLAVAGVLTFADGSRRPFVTRSYPFAFAGM